MTDAEKREKVIFAIENCLTTDSVTECKKTECPFISCRESCLEWLLRSALSMLKEHGNEYENGFNDAMLGKQELMYEGTDGKWHKKDW